MKRYRILPLLDVLLKNAHKIEITRYLWEHRVKTYKRYYSYYSRLRGTERNGKGFGEALAKRPWLWFHKA
jgi:hypothetical protein